MCCDLAAYVHQAHQLEIRHKEYYERLLGLPPELGYSRKSVFLEDPAGRFKELLLAGQHAQSALARSSPCGHPQLWKPTRLVRATLCGGKDRPFTVGCRREAAAALCPCPTSLILLPLTIQAGREYDLVVLSVLTYGTFDMIYEDTFIAIFATYLVDLAVRFARRDLAKKNIAAKTLIDDRLLL